jgi:DNA-binding MarR family transcriptional regulator
MASLNEIIHQPVRLRIMAMLAVLSPETQTTFAVLKEALDLTDGNLGAHLHKLEEAGYLTITKAFVRNKPQTYIQATEAGRSAFLEHRNALREILESSRQISSNGETDTTKEHLL